MKNPLDHPAMTDISLFLARLTLGLFMLLAGLHKLSGGIGRFVDKSFMPLRPQWLPEGIARPYGYALPVLEFAGGLLVVLGLFTRWSAGAVCLVLLSIFVAVVTDGGIAGGEHGPFHYSLVLSTMAFVLAVVGAGRLSLDALYSGGGNAQPAAGRGK